MGKNSFKKTDSKQKKADKKSERRTVIDRRRTRSLMQIMNGDFLSKDFVLNNLNIIFFVLGLLLIAVGKVYYVNQLISDIAKEEIMLEDVTSDYVETKAKLEEMTRRTQMISRLEPLGLKETVNPTKVIRIEKGSVK